MTDQFTVDHNEYQRRTRLRAQAKRQKVITSLRTGEWAAAEDAIVLREDITLVEMMAMTQRPEGAIRRRIQVLCSGTYKDCEYCGRSTLRLPEHRFCGKACARAAQRREKLFTCPVCGKQEIRKPSLADRRTYCSRECFGVAHRREERWERTSICPQCGDEFTIILERDANGKRRYSNRKHCSKECWRASLQVIPLSLPCPTCGVDFKPKLGIQVYCSMVCSKRMLTMRAEEKKRRDCQHCGVSFVAKQLTSQGVELGKYCSRECFGRAHKKLPDTIQCENCQKPFKPTCRTRRYCSNQCRGRGAAPELVARNRARKTRFECSVEECSGAGPYTRGLCRKHYSRWKKYGTTDDPTLWNQDNTPEACTVDGCDELHAARGWCNTHYLRWRLKGDPLAHIPIRKQKKPRQKA